MTALDHDEMTNQAQIIIVDPAHPIARGLTGTVMVASSPQRFAWGLPRAASASVVGTLTDGRPCLFGYDTSALLIDEITPTPARRLHVFLASTAYANLMPTGLQLIDQAVGSAVNRDLAVGVGGQPELVATTVENGQITITWRNGSLESTASLTPPVAWQDLGTSGTFTGPSGSGMRFFG